MTEFEQYVSSVAEGLNVILTAQVTVEEVRTPLKGSNLYIQIKYKHKTFALTPYFLVTQFKSNKSVNETVSSGFEFLRDAVIRAFGINQLEDFSKKE